MSAGTIAGDRIRSLAGPGTDAEGVAAATFGVCRELLDLGAGAVGLLLAGELPALPPPGSATPQHPRRAGPGRGPTTEGGPGIWQRSR